MSDPIFSAIAKRGRLPVTPYEVFGYLVPGGMFYLSILLFELWTRDVASMDSESSTLITPWLSGMATVSGFVEINKDTNWAYALLFFLALLLVCYLIGHFIASVASITIDKLVIHAYGHPWSSYFRSPHITFRTKRFYRQANLKSLIVIFHAAAIIMIIKCWRLITTGSFQIREVNIVNVVICIYFILVIAHIHELYKYRVRNIRDNTSLLPGTPALGSHSIQNVILFCGMLAAGYMLIYIVDQVHSLKYAPFAILGALLLVLRYSRRVALASYCCLYEAIARPASSFTWSRSYVDPDFQGEFELQYRKTFRHTVKSYYSAEVFWRVYYYILANSPELFGMIQMRRQSYTFIRNISAAMYLSLLYCFVWFVINRSAFPLSANPNTLGVLIWVPISYLSIGIAMLMRFYHIHKEYYSKNVFRYFVILSKQPPRP